MRKPRIALLASLASALACGDDGGGGSGKLRVLLSAEETITEGLTPGPGPEQTRDCAVSYSRFLVAIGRVKVFSTKRNEMRADPNLYLADMRQVGEQGPEIALFSDLPSGQWDKFEYETPSASAEAKPIGAVSPADAAEMIAKGLTYWIDGSVQCPERTVAFSFQVSVPTRFYDCESDGEPGVAVSGGGASAARVTLHGDHMWFDSLPNGSEGTVTRRAAWILEADPDGDGKVVTEDLESVRAEDAFPSSLGYNLSGGNISTAFDFVRAQLGTQGHLNGEGECLWRAL